MVLLGFFALSTFMSGILALPNPDANAKSYAPFQITDLNIFEPSGRPRDSSRYTVSFSVKDPSDGSSTTCSTDWAYENAMTGYPSNYLANCTDPAYAFKFVEYNRYYDFKLDVKHAV